MWLLFMPEINKLSLLCISYIIVSLKFVVISTSVILIGSYKGADYMSKDIEVKQNTLKVINKYKNNGEDFQVVLQRTLQNKKINNYRIIAKERFTDEQNL